MPRALSFWCKIVFSHIYEFICSKVLNEFEQMHPCYVKIPLSFFCFLCWESFIPCFTTSRLTIFSSDYYTNYSLAFFPCVSAVPQCRGWLQEHFNFWHMKMWRSREFNPLWLNTSFRRRASVDKYSPLAHCGQAILKHFTWLPIRDPSGTEPLLPYTSNPV